MKNKYLMPNILTLIFLLYFSSLICINTLKNDSQNDTNLANDGQQITNNNETGQNLLSNSNTTNTSSQLILLTDQLITKINQIFDYLSKDLQIKERISKEIQDVVFAEEDIRKHYELTTIEENYQLAIISRKITEKLINKLKEGLIEVDIQISEIKTEITKNNIQIELLKQTLPNNNIICSELTACSDCTANPKCGWCGSSETCIEGNQNSPANNNCEYYSYEKCPNEKECDSLLTCDDCIFNPACGWCNNLSLNKAVCITKIAADDEFCNSNFFIHIFKTDPLLNRCPVIKQQNFISYVDNNINTPLKLDGDSDDSSSEIENSPLISEQQNLIEKLEQANIANNIKLDQLYKKFYDYLNDIKDLSEMLTNVDEQLNICQKTKDESKY